jgi:hypothetical protein
MYPGDGMRDVVQKTWFATLMFAVSIVGIGVALGWIDPHGAWINVAIVILVTVPTWWVLIGRRGSAGPGQGAFAGALCAALVFLVPIVFLILTIIVRGPGQGDGVIGIMALAGMLVMAIPLGAAVGTITVLLQRRWLA